MKKGILGTLTLILGIVLIISGVIYGIFPDGSLIGKIAYIPTLIGWLPVVVLGIIAIVKNSNRVKAIIGMVLAVCAMWIVPLLIRIITK